MKTINFRSGPTRNVSGLEININHLMGMVGPKPELISAQNLILTFTSNKWQIKRALFNDVIGLSYAAHE